MSTAQFECANLQDTYILGPIKASTVRHIQQRVVLVIVQASHSQCLHQPQSCQTAVSSLDTFVACVTQKKHKMQLCVLFTLFWNKLRPLRSEKTS